jgi:hypothetical protein
MSAVSENPTMGFGDTVRIITSPATIAAGVAGLEGEVHGFTTPSATGVTVIDPTGIDYAIAVYVEQLGEAIWLEPNTLELISRPDEMVFTTGSKKITARRTEDGSMVETIEDIYRKPWWRFW